VEVEILPQGFSNFKTLGSLERGKSLVRAVYAEAESLGPLQSTDFTTLQRSFDPVVRSEQPELDATGCCCSTDTLTYLPK